MAGRCDIKIDQGADFSRKIVIGDTTDTPINFTGATVKAQIRAYPAKGDVLAEFACAFNTPATDGVITISLPAATSASLPTPAKRTPDVEPVLYSYDLVVTDTNGVKTRYLEGNVILSPSTTR